MPRRLMIVAIPLSVPLGHGLRFQNTEGSLGTSDNSRISKKLGLTSDMIRGQIRRIGHHCAGLACRKLSTASELISGRNSVAKGAAVTEDLTAATGR